MIQEIVRKGLIIGIITLFMSLTALPALSTGQLINLGDKNRKFGITEAMDTPLETRGNTIEIELTEYRPDGSYETRMVELPLDMVREIMITFQNLKDPISGFTILKKYGLIPEGTRLEDWRRGMQNRAQTLGVLPGNAKALFQLSMEAARLKLPFMVSVLNRVDAVSVIGSRTRIGFPFYRGLVKFLTRFRFVDLFDICGGLVGIINTKNLIRQHSLVTIPSVMGMVGFVGMHIHIPFILNIYTGFSAMTFAAGLGIHTVDFLPWIPNSNMD